MVAAIANFPAEFDTVPARARIIVALIMKADILPSVHRVSSISSPASLFVSLSLPLYKTHLSSFTPVLCFTYAPSRVTCCRFAIRCSRGTLLFTNTASDSHSN